jgi:hypothetical protein
MRVVRQKIERVGEEEEPPDNKQEGEVRKYKHT